MDKGEKVGLFIYKENRFATLRIMFSAIISASLLLLPVFLLFLVSMPRIAMVILVFGFVVVFTVVLSVIAEGRPQEILVGVAAYVFAFPHISKADILLVILRSLPPSWAI